MLHLYWWFFFIASSSNIEIQLLIAALPSCNVANLCNATKLQVTCNSSIVRQENFPTWKFSTSQEQKKSYRWNKCFPTRKSTHSMRNCFFFVCTAKIFTQGHRSCAHTFITNRKLFLIQRRIETNWDSGVVEFLTTIFLDNTCRDFYLHTASKQQHNTKLQLRTLCRARHQASWCAHQERRENITPFIIRHCVVCCLSGVVWDTFSPSALVFVRRMRRICTPSSKTADVIMWHWRNLQCDRAHSKKKDQSCLSIIWRFHLRSIGADAACALIVKASTKR